MTFADACANAWTPTNVFWLIVGLFVLASYTGILDRRED